MAPVVVAEEVGLWQELSGRWRRRRRKGLAVRTLGTVTDSIKLESPVSMCASCTKGPSRIRVVSGCTASSCGRKPSSNFVLSLGIVRDAGSDQHDDGGIGCCDICDIRSFGEQPGRTTGRLGSTGLRAMPLEGRHSRHSGASTAATAARPRHYQ